MKISKSFVRMVTGTTMMFAGVLLMFVEITLPAITETVFGNVVNLVIGGIPLAIGLGIFTNQLRLPKRQKKERVYQKSTHKLIKIFGLE